MVMMATNTYPSCEIALQDIVLPPRNQQHTLADFRSQLHKAQASMTRVAKCTEYEQEIRHIYRVPLSTHEVEEIYAACTDCAFIITGDKHKRPPKRRNPRSSKHSPEEEQQRLTTHDEQAAAPQETLRSTQEVDTNTLTSAHNKAMRTNKIRLEQSMKKDELNAAANLEAISSRYRLA